MLDDSSLQANTVQNTSENARSARVMNYRACVRRIKPVIPHITRSYIRYCYNANDHISARKQTHQRTKSNTSTHANYHINTRKQPPQHTQTTALTHANNRLNARTTSSTCALRLQRIRIHESKCFSAMSRHTAMYRQYSCTTYDVRLTSYALLHFNPWRIF